MRKPLTSWNQKTRWCFVTSTSMGKVTPESNPNGSLHNIAGICNQARNVVGMMPHPDRAWDEKLGSEDGKLLFGSLGRNLGTCSLQINAY